MSELLERLGRDRDHGADTLARWAVESLRDRPDREWARRLANARPGMPVIGHRVAVAWQDLEAGQDPMARLEAEFAAMQAAAPPMERVVTMSRSSTVAAVLAATKPHVDVWTSEPGGEGRAMVKDLQAAGVEAEEVPDGTPGSVALLGVDAILPDGMVWGKVGVRWLAEAADTVWVAAATAKIVERDLDWLEARAYPQEWFHAVQADLIDGYITEQGILRQEDLQEAGRPHWEALEAL